VIVNAATRDKDLAWLSKHQSGDVTIKAPDGNAMLAVQGPNALEKAHASVETINPEIAAMFEGLQRFASVWKRGCTFMATIWMKNIQRLNPD